MFDLLFTLLGLLFSFVLWFFVFNSILVLV